MTSTITRPTWEDLTEAFGSEEYLAAIRLLQLSSIQHDAIQWASHTEYGPTIDWEGWVRDVDEQGRGWSSTEHRLFALIASLVIPERPMKIVYCLELMGSNQRQVLEVLVDWASGGNNKDRPGTLRIEAVGR